MPENRRRTGNSTSFKPGQTGNPGGRPKRTQEQKDALEMIKALAPEAVERLKEIITDPSIRPDTRLKAIEIVLERTYGKAFACEIVKDDPVTVIIDV